MKERNVFELYPTEYDEWFDRHADLYHAELAALRRAVPDNKKGIEIGVGTGRFAVPLNIKYGVEPSEGMASIAERRGLSVYRGLAEMLPIDDASFEFVLMVTTVCFLSDIPKAFSEAYRILKPKGEIILAIIDKDSELGRKYEHEKLANKFYRDAHFHTTREITDLLSNAGFGNFSYWQTLVDLDDSGMEQPAPGFGKGSFVVIKSEKNT